jgi:hypothetical protein
MLNIASVERWLSSLPDDEVVGRTRSSCQCPLAQFLRFDNAPSPVVQHCVYARKKSNALRPLPVWACKFIRIIDAIESDFVSAGEALTFLRQITHKVS